MRILLALLLCSLLPACTPHKRTDQSPGSTTLVWISIDGCKGTYLPDPATTPAADSPAPYLASLLERSYYTRQLIPIFPSLTFPSHASEATGAPAAVHAIPSNAFYDPVTRQKYSFPDDASLLHAEPIWLTAARQQVRTAVLDWPFSYQDKLPAGVTRTAYYSPGYDASLSDRARLTRLADTYAADFASHPNQPPLRLLMCYIHDIDTAGHRHGPDSPEVRQAVADTDALLKDVLTSIAATFDAHAGPHDSLYVLLTTDHGMAPVTSTTNLRRLLGGALPESAFTTTAGPLALLYLHDLPPNERPAATRSILTRLAPHPDLRTEAPLLHQSAIRNPKSAIAPFLHPTRRPDVVVLLPNNQTFYTPSATVRPPKGMHGYDPASTPDMHGFALLAPLRGPHRLTRSTNLGPLDSLRLHPTAARLLHISPSPQATQPPLNLPK